MGQWDDLTQTLCSVQTDKMENEKEMLFEIKIQIKEIKNNQNEQRTLFNQIRQSSLEC